MNTYIIAKSQFVIDDDSAKTQQCLQNYGVNAVADAATKTAGHNHHHLHVLFDADLAAVMQSHDITQTQQRISKKSDVHYLRCTSPHFDHCIVSCPNNNNSHHLIAIKGQDVTVYNAGNNRSHEATAIRIMRELAFRDVEREGGIMLHAASVEHHGKGYLVLGDSGSGKSTSLLSLMNAGASYISNDRCLIDQDLNIYGWPYTIRIGAGSLKMFHQNIEQVDVESQTLSSFSDNFERQNSDIFQWGSRNKAVFNVDRLCQLFNTTITERIKLSKTLLPNLSLQSDDLVVTSKPIPFATFMRNNLSCNDDDYSRNWLVPDNKNQDELHQDAEKIFAKLNLGEVVEVKAHPQAMVEQCKAWLLQ